MPVPTKNRDSESARHAASPATRSPPAPCQPWGGARAAAVLALLLAACAEPPPAEYWHVTMPHSSFGPLEILATTRQRDADTLSLVSSSAATTQLRALPGAAAPVVDLGAGSWAFALARDGDAWRGESQASRAGDPIEFTRDAASFTARIGKGWFSGALEGRRLAHAPDRALRDYPAVVRRLEATLRERLYDPALVDSPAVQAYLARLRAVAERTHDDVDLLLAGRWAWDADPPFSHFELRRSLRSADELTAHFDAMDAPGEPIVLERVGTMAILRVQTMMGVNTRQRLQAAMREIVAEAPEGLLVDLRGNPGGAFAVIDLIEPLLLAPLDLGRFHGAGRPRRPGDDGAPESAVAWRGDTLAGFWAALAEHGALAIHGVVREQRYAGPVVVLVDRQTASAAELAAQALQDACRAVLVGERTAGAMLSGSYFDLGEGFQAYLPVGDYYTAAGKRIEGAGVDPDVLVEGERAQARALHLLASGAASPREQGTCASDRATRELASADRDWIQQVMAAAGVVGYAVAEVERGLPPAIFTAGWANPATGDPVRADTAFQVASLGKLVSALAAHRLATNGRLDLDGAVASPTADDRCPPASVRDVLAHRGGFASSPASLAPRTNCAAAAAFRYSGQGYRWLGESLARSADAPAADVVVDAVLHPLGMRRSRFGEPLHGPAAVGQVSGLAFAIGRTIRWLGWPGSIVVLLVLIGAWWWIGAALAQRRRTWRAAWWLASAGVLLLAGGLGLRTNRAAQSSVGEGLLASGMTSSIQDMARFAQELVEPTRLGPALPQGLAEIGALGSDCLHWGLGPGIDRCGARETWWQWGSNLGFQSLLVVDPTRDRAVVVITNTGGGLDAVVPGRGGYPAARQVAARLLGVEGRWRIDASLADRVPDCVGAAGASASCDAARAEVLALEKGVARVLAEEGFSAYAARFDPDFTQWADGRPPLDRAGFLERVRQWHVAGVAAVSTRMVPIAVEVSGDRALSRYVLREDFNDGTSFVGCFNSLARRSDGRWRLYRTLLTTRYRGPSAAAPEPAAGASGACGPLGRP